MRARIGVTGMAALAALGVIALTAPSGPSAASPAHPPSAAPRVTAGVNDWTVYHHDPGGSGVDASGATTPARAAWTSPALNGQIYGEPLALGGDVYVATEKDEVYALSGATGAVLWSTSVGTPVPSSDLPCTDISPDVGVTSTPVIDPARNEIFVAADELVSGAAQHHLHGLDLTTGASDLDQVVDPPGSDPLAQLQRVALNLDTGRVLVGYGGNAGDCSDYHGWMVSAPEAGGALQSFEVDAASGDSQGAVWMGGGAPVVDANGDIWLSSGNGSVTSSTGTYDDSDAVLELSPSLSLLQYFAPSTWATDNALDEDLGSSSPAVLPDGYVFQAGKSHIAFLMRQSSLGGIGGQAAQLTSFCSGDVDGGDAFAGSVVYAPCGAGVEAVQVGVSPPSLTLLWRTSSGAAGPPIVAAGLVWTIGGGTLYGLNPSTGAAVEQFSIGSDANHFPTPAVGDGLLLAPTSDQVHAFYVDNTPPTTSVILPAAGASVGGGQWVAASASDNVGVTRVEFRLTGGTLSNALIATGASTQYGWLGLWSATSVPDRTYTLTSVAYDAAGNHTTSAGVSIVVDNTPPTTTLVLPASGATLAGGQWLAASASDNVGVTRVEFRLTGGALSDALIATGVSTQYGWLALWSSASVANGSYTMTSVAYDAAGNHATSAGVPVVVSNH